MRLHRSLTRWRERGNRAYRRRVTSSLVEGLRVHPVQVVRSRGVGWSKFVEIASAEALDALPFLRLSLEQPAYSEPPSLRLVPELARVAALGQAFASLIYEHTRPLDAAAFSARPLSRCRLQGSQRERRESQGK